MRLILTAVGTRMPKWVEEGFTEFAKRMPRDCPLDLVEVKAEPRTTGKTPAAMMAAEADRIRSALPSRRRLVILDERGEDLTSRALSDRLKRWMAEGDDVAIVIGGPDGLDPEIKNQAHERIRLSSLTLPHAMVRVMLAEALYRAWSLPSATTLTTETDRSGSAPCPPLVRPASISPPVARVAASCCKQIGVEFDTLIFRDPPRDDEDVCEDAFPGEHVEDYVVRIARAKAEAGLKRLDLRSMRKQPVLSADTTLDVDDEIIGKPDNATHARDILRKLSGRQHRVLTAVAVAEDDRLECLVSTSTVHFRELSEDDILRYIRTGEPFDKAGAYGIQGHAGAFHLANPRLLHRHHGFAPL